MVFRLAHNAFAKNHSWSRQPQIVLLNKVMGGHDASSFPGSLFLHVNAASFLCNITCDSTVDVPSLGS